jgi:myo-inositol-1(or 4)-monophosphatase
MLATDIADYVKRQRFAEVMAQEAGALAFDFFKRRDALVIEMKKNPQDVVSIADREVEMLIREKIGDSFANDSILGEEYGLTQSASGFTWVIDPIDGTSPFVNGIPTWCISIAVLHKGEPVVGVICAPCQGELYSAAYGSGAFLDGRTLRLDASRSIRNAVTGIGANHHVPPRVVADVVEALLSEGGTFIRNGSGALMLAYVAAGRLVGYYEPYMHAWDCLAGYCLVREAGGWFLPFPVEGERLMKGAPVLAAAPGAIQDLRSITGL